MAWIYRITDGFVFDAADVHRFTGYSGAGHDLASGRNNAAMQGYVAKGPIPEGAWQIGSPHTSPNTGPFTMVLSPIEGTDTHGRSAFRIHGNNEKDDASHGCVILPRPAREAIWASGDHILRVVR